MRRRTEIAAFTIAVVLTPFILGYACWRHQYPYGWSHWCDLHQSVSLALENLATTDGDAKVWINDDEVKVQIRVVDGEIYGFALGDGLRSLKLIATTKNGMEAQEWPIIPIEEIKKAKVVVEQDKARVRFVLRGREIIYDKSGFRIEAIPKGETKE